MADASTTDEPPNFMTTARIRASQALYFRKTPKKRPPVLWRPAAGSFRRDWASQFTCVSTLIGQFQAKQGFRLVVGGLHPGLIEQLMDLVLDPGAGIGRDGAQRLPLGLSQVDGEKSAGVLAHETQSNA